VAPHSPPNLPFHQPILPSEPVSRFVAGLEPDKHSRKHFGTVPRSTCNSRAIRRYDQCCVCNGSIDSIRAILRTLPTTALLPRHRR
jgi:hypothetical protein